MSNTGERYIYRLNIPRLKNPVRYRVRIYYGCENVEVGFFRTIEEAIKARDKFMKDNGISKEIFKHYNRRENG